MKKKAMSHLIPLISILLLIWTAESMAAPTASEWQRGGTDAYPLNIDLIANPQPAASNSSTLANYLYSHTGGAAGHYTVNAKDWTYAWYWTEDATTLTCATTGGQYNLPQIPWNPAWKVPGGTDAQVIITDRTTGKEIMLYGASVVSTNPCKVSASVLNFVGQDTTYGNDTPADYRLKDNNWKPAWSPGIPYTKRVTTRAELERGAVDHAMSMPSNLEASSWVAPAMQSDGPATNGSTYPIPAGTRFQLNPANWSDASCNTWANGKNVNAALKDIAAKLCKGLLHYGAYISDRSGVSHIQLEADASANWNTYCVNGACASASGMANLLDGLIRSANDWVAIVPSDKYVLPSGIQNPSPTLAPPNPPSGLSVN